MTVVRAALLTAVAIVAAQRAEVDPRAQVAERVSRLTRDAKWRPAAEVPLAFRAHHPQGLVKIGAAFFLSSVEVRTRTRRFPQPVGGFDRDTGAGVGHLFQFDPSGKLVAAITLGEGSMYHPGGIDYDGEHIWVSVAEYRPDSRSIVYRVDPRAMKATEVFRFADHIGAIVHDTDEGALHGVSWGSRRFYRWPLGADGRITNPDATPEGLRRDNPSHYVDYQDCKYVRHQQMLCAGVTEIRAAPALFRLGGLELIDLRDGRPRHQVPVLLWTPGGLAMTQNPVWVEPTAQGLRAYFVPEDDASRLYVFEADTK